MKRYFTLILFSFLLTSLSQSANAFLVSDAGTASVTEDTVCSSYSSTLLLTGYTGAIQWQSFDGSNWINETGTGATTDSYQVTPLVTTDYRAVVTDAGFPPDTSNVVTITVGVPPPSTTGATRCGYGPVTLSATGSGSTIRWYDVPSGGAPLASGNTFSPVVSSTTTYYAAESSNGGVSGSPGIPFHSAVYTGFTRGYWFTAPVNFTITSLYIPTDASTDNQSVAVLSYPAGPIPPAGNNVTGFTTLFMSQNNTATGPIPAFIQVFAGEHILILGNRGSDTIDDFAAINSYDDGQPFTTTIDGINVDLNRGGMQSNLTGFDPAVTGVLIVQGAGQRGRIIFEYQIGCESTRTPAVATVTAPPAISISAVPPSLCQGQSSAITASSSNSNYSYTWSPATGLSGTTGATVTATPLSPITYTVIADDGTCGNIDSVFISVGPASVAGTAVISTDTICSGSSAYLTLSGYTGNIQWQSFDGTNWVNETGPGSTTDNYEIFPSGFTTYQAVVTSGGCDPDTTISLTLEVLTIVDPVTVNDTICAPGVANLSASGTGNLNWFTAPTGGTSINTGTTYNPNVATTTTYYVEASAGANYLLGPANLGIGSQQSLAGNEFGLQFDVIQQSVIKRVWVSPGITSGNIIINLKDAGGIVVDSETIPVSANSGLVPVELEFTVNPGTYSLTLATGSVFLNYNTTNAVYPYATAGSPVTITGYMNPNFGTGQFYYFFYNWEVSEGCASSRVPVIAVVNTPPAVPVISQNGTVLTSSAPANNQWYMDGNIMWGQTGTTLDMAIFGSGSYTVTVTVDGCSSTSLPLIYVGMRDDLAAAGISVFPNPVKDILSVSFNQLKGNTVLNIYNSLGELVHSREIQELKTEILFNYPAGVYTMEVKTSHGKYVTSIVRL